MIHFLPESFSESAEAEAPVVAGPYAEAVARLASIRQALACVDEVAGDPPSESMAEAKLAAGWPVASPARQRVYDARSARIASAAAAGLETIASHHDAGRRPNSAALARFRDEIGRGVESVDQLFSL
ncbi:hypothetical protein [Sphingomonas xanthus]|uniref:Uncharacterized protein n=1 Tax=Sphingomonas xanthus TaxID=2594473 RepID=A0A516IQK1_9SPHN|nr:hypothetical protein [Sphingomonas xanthus]QDP19191.1 hypothetical protein FMM02_03960 [Sphingomonas xanthus]